MKRLLKQVVSSLHSDQSTVVLDQGKMSLGRRLLAWWHGQNLKEQSGPRSERDELRLRSRAPSNANGKAGETAASQSGPGRGPAGAQNRVRQAKMREPVQDLKDGQLLNCLWDRPVRIPGGMDAALELMKPVLEDLPPYKEILDICAADGGFLEHMEIHHRAVTVGYDINEDLCGRSHGQVRHFDPVRANFGDEERFDYVCALEGLQDMEAREEVLKAATGAMKLGGKMIIVDAIGQAREGKAPYLARHDGFLAPVLSARYYKKILADCGLKILDTKNVSGSYQSNMIRGWRRAAEFFQERQLDRNTKDLLNDEASHQLARVKTLRDGNAKMLRMELTK